MSNFNSVVGETITKVCGLSLESDCVEFAFESGKTARLLHYNDCYEHVRLIDFDGDVSDLIGGTIVAFEEEVSENQWPVVGYDFDMPEASSYTWTFYKIQTTKGYVWLRWLGESNGCYSESVTFEVSDN
jgi:2-methylcitrate dehydratase PrpD